MADTHSAALLLMNSQLGLVLNSIAHGWFPTHTLQLFPCSWDGWRWTNKYANVIQSLSSSVVYNVPLEINSGWLHGEGGRQLVDIGNNNSPGTERLCDFPSFTQQVNAHGIRWTLLSFLAVANVIVFTKISLYLMPNKHLLMSIPSNNTCSRIKMHLIKQSLRSTSYLVGIHGPSVVYNQAVTVRGRVHIKETVLIGLIQLNEFNHPWKHPFLDSLLCPLEFEMLFNATGTGWWSCTLVA